jgi:hypothetical protein
VSIFALFLRVAAGGAGRGGRMVTTRVGVRGRFRREINGWFCFSGPGILFRRAWFKSAPARGAAGLK